MFLEIKILLPMRRWKLFSCPLENISNRRWFVFKISHRKFRWSFGIFFAGSMLNWRNRSKISWRRSCMSNSFTQSWFLQSSKPFDSSIPSTSEREPLPEIEFIIRTRRFSRMALTHDNWCSIKFVYLVFSINFSNFYFSNSLKRQVRHSLKIVYREKTTNVGKYHKNCDIYRPLAPF